jgi:branched-chain amino acid transport system ATP-binding protein
MTALLEVAAAATGYGDVAVLFHVDLTVTAGAITCLIGSNGAGKTTLLRLLSGTLKLQAGQILLRGESLGAASPKARVAQGVVHVPEGRRLFAGMSVRENLLMGAFLRGAAPPLRKRNMDRVLAIFPRLAERLRQDASTLSGGEQQMCAIGRGLMADPVLLLIDELSLGLSPLMVDELCAALTRVNAEQGTTILLVEQDVHTALSLASAGVVLDRGRTILAGPSAMLGAHKLVREAYLGTAPPDLIGATNLESTP